MAAPLRPPPPTRTPVITAPERPGQSRLRDAGQNQIQPPKPTVIAAAREAGLRWQQHLLIIAGLPGHEPRIEPAPAAIGARLLGGRHIAAHRAPLVFTTIESEATNA